MMNPRCLAAALVAALLSLFLAFPAAAHTPAEHAARPAATAGTGNDSDTANTDADAKTDDTSKDDKDDWDITAHHGPGKYVEFSVDEGTWMDIDVSPDGDEIVFSLLGDLYRLPISGGKAERVTSGPAWDIQPRWSPDGKAFTFTSDRSGGNNIWRIDIDGKNPVQVTDEDFRLLNTPAWTPDGQYIVARKHFTSTRSLGAGALWIYHISGGDGLELVHQRNKQQDLGEPSVSPDGRYVYYSQDVSEGPRFQYNKDPYGVIYAVKRLDRQTGDTDTLISTAGGAIRPQPSPNGQKLAFIKRVRDKTMLYVMDLDSGKARPVWDGLSHDQQEAWAVFGPYTGYAWTPDSKSVVIWAKGHIWRVNIASSEASEIPFTAHVRQWLTKPLRFTHDIPEGSFAPKLIRDVATSRDGETLIFHAVGKLWRKALPSGKPARLTDNQGVYEYQPAFSADGNKLLYTTWSDDKLGAIWLRSARGDARGRKLTTEPGYYYHPRFSPDGRMVVYAKTGGSALTGHAWTMDQGIYVVPATGDTPRRIVDEGYAPQFNANGTRVYYMTGGGLEKKLMSVGLHGEDPRTVFKLKYPNQVTISPDGKWVAFTELFKAYVAPMVDTGKAIELSKDSKAIPVARVSADVGHWLHWAGDSKSLHWMMGNRYHSRALADSFAFLAGGKDKIEPPAPGGGIAVGLEVPVDDPQQVVVFTHARIITMRDADKREEVISDGTIVLDGDTIVAVGPSSDVTIPADARVIDASGKTILPGYIDVHGHAMDFGAGVVPQQNWAYYANLAFGFTTIHDPSASTNFVFSQAELIRAGNMVGPRIFSTGSILYGADGDFKVVINSLDDAMSHLRRLKAMGAFSVKSYNQPRREQHQMINTAARKLGMLVVEEGGSTFHHNLPMILDGVTGIEHNTPIAPLYADVIKLWSETDVRNTPTLVVSYGGLSGEYWWYAHTNVWQNDKLLRYVPRSIVDARSIRRQIGPDWDYFHVTVAETAKKLRDAGIGIQVGGHGQLQGLSPHWEIWSLVQGGFSNFEALRAATIDGADYLGLSGDLGSLEIGKQADLVVLDQNPLEDIHATTSTHYVMVNGRLFDVTADMAEIGNHKAPAPTFYWADQRLD